MDNLNSLLEIKRSSEFLPTSLEDFPDNTSPDFILISGDAYVDHPSFGGPLIARVLNKYGYSVLINPQPNIKNNEDFTKFGTPNLGFLVTSGNIESMVNNYYVSKKRRKFDDYSENGDCSKRPDRAFIKYTKKLRENFPHTPIIGGGIEGSLRRFAHYDYWSDQVMKSILMDSSCDLLVYGMGEKSIVEIADYLKSGLAIRDLTFIKGTSFVTENLEIFSNYKMLPSYKNILKDKVTFLESFKTQQEHLDYHNETLLIEPYGDSYVVQNPPMERLSKSEFDNLYDLPFTYKKHPMYKGDIPALREMEFSITLNRGCLGNCSFCAITYHQGRQVQMRSKESVIKEGIFLSQLEDFKGYIHDVGGATANFNDHMCEKLRTKGPCKDKNCIGFKKCSNLVVDHNEYLEILRALRTLPNIKKVFIRSGIRYDYLMDETNEKVFKEIVEHHVSGQLRFAPEHISNNVLKLMNKPPFHIYEQSVKKFQKISRKLNKEQYVLPYLISSHPGSTLEDSIILYEYLKSINFQPKQVQDFYPTPGTLSTVMYYTELNPATSEALYVPKTFEDKEIQRALLQYKNPKYKDIISKALKNRKVKDSNNGKIQKSTHKSSKFSKGKKRQHPTGRSKVSRP